MEMENNKAKEEKPSTSTAGLAGAAGDGPSSRTWKCEGEVVSSRIIPVILITIVLFHNILLLYDILSYEKDLIICIVYSSVIRQPWNLTNLAGKLH